MAEFSKEELVQLIKRLGAYLTLKISNLFSISSSSNHQSSRPVWALVGLAIAFFFTWKILRAPSGHQRRRQQRRQRPLPGVSGVSTQTNAVMPSAGAFSYSDEIKAQDVLMDHFFLSSGKPTLAQLVRQKLNEGRKVTCRLLGVILEESSPEDLQKHVTVKSSAVEVLLEITKFCDLYLMERVLDDESVEKVLLALDDAGVFTSGGLVKDKVIFCSTENGRSSFVRQLEPDWHIDSNPDIISQLARFIKYQLLISPNRPERIASNVFSSSSLEQFFGYSDRN